MNERRGKKAMTRREAALLCAGLLAAPMLAPSDIALAASDDDLKAALQECKQHASERKRDECVSQAKKRHSARGAGGQEKDKDKD